MIIILLLFFSKRKYVLCAKDEKERKEWMTEMGNLIESSRQSTIGTHQIYEKQGYLQKRGQRRFFCLRKTHLVWYKTEQQSQIQNSVSLQGGSCRLKDSATLIVENKTRYYELTAKSKEQAEDWVRCIKAAIEVSLSTPYINYSLQKSWPVTVAVSLDLFTSSGFSLKGLKTNEPVGIEVDANMTAHEAKIALFKQLCQDYITSKLSPEHLAAEYWFKQCDTNYFILTEQIPLSECPFVKYCRSCFLIPSLELVKKQDLIDTGLTIQDIRDDNEKFFSLEEEAKITQEINFMIGDTYLNILAEKCDPENEVNVFRRKMASFRLATNEQIKDRLPQFTHNEPLPQKIPPKLTITCTFPGNNQKSTLQCSCEETVSNLKSQIFQKYRTINGGDQGIAANDTPDDYLLKATGLRSYLVGQTKLLEYDHVRTALNHQQGNIDLTLVKLENSHVFRKEGPSVFDLLLSDKMDQHKRTLTQTPSMRTMTRLLSIQIKKITNISIPELISPTTIPITVSCQLTHAGKALEPGIITKSQVLKYQPGPSAQQEPVVFNMNLSFGTPLRELPRSARLCITVMANIEGKERALAWGNLLLINFRNKMATGPGSLRLWPGGPANPIGTCVENLSSTSPCVLFYEFDNSIFNYEDPNTPPHTPTVQAPTPKDKGILEVLIEKDSLSELRADELGLLWEHRLQDWVVNNAKALPKFLKAVNWSKPEQVADAHQALHRWAKPSAVQALELLDSGFDDAKVRSYAVDILDALPDGDLVDYMLQLTQVLKYEPYHDSALARFLMKRALLNKDRIGHLFFWHLKSEMHVPEIAERYGVLLESYLRGCGTIYRTELFKQVQVVEKLTVVAQHIKTFSDRKERLDVLHEKLNELELPTRFQLPQFTHLEFKGLIINKCRVMKSKKLPLWLTFENADRNGSPLVVLFKCGDDLRQDVLTLQMIRLMDKFWTQEGWDLCLKPYHVIATGDEIGFVEVVLNAETTASIARDAGGSSKVLVKDTLSKWLQSKNPNNYDEAVETFCRSCAGYCVATYVLGIGDRHNDNIMITNSGNLFHIDFGHFLGHFKKKWGYEREKAPFVFTPQYAHILGGVGSPMYKKFEEICSIAYNIVRTKSVVFINLFQMMLSTGLAELQSIDNILFLKEKLQLEATPDQASKHFSQQIDASLHEKTTQIMDVIHIFANE